jgi:F0F1-type ATP synthase gamma subunit
VTSVGTKARTFVEKCHFLFKTYQHSTPEKLLEFMVNATDIGHLRKLGQRYLAIIYCERMAHAMQTQEDARMKASGPAKENADCH